MTDRSFIYVMHNRLIWVSRTIFHIPVLSDLYSAHLFTGAIPPDASQYSDYFINSSHVFQQNKLYLKPLTEEKGKNEFLVQTEKVKHFVRLCEFVNYSYRSLLPPVFFEESDKIDLLSESLVDFDATTPNLTMAHRNFVGQIITDKKLELKKRYLRHVGLLKNALTLDEVIEVGHSIVYSVINVT